MRRAALAAEDGFTLIELMVALLLLTVGIFAVATTFDLSRASTNQSELETSAIDRAQREIEAVRALPYEQVAHPTGGVVAGSDDPADPTSRLAGSSFRWNRGGGSAAEPLVSAATGTVPMKQVVPKGVDDRFGYTIWRFVTQTTEPACATAVDCADGGGDYRRVTVVVRASGLGDILDPVWTSTTVIDPAEAANNDGQPQTLCQNDAGSQLELCSAEAEGEPLSFHLTNTPATSGDERAPIPPDPVDRELHRTVRIPPSCTAGSASGCPVPDLMVEQSLPTLEPEDIPAPVSFATDVDPPFGAGRPLIRDAVGCGESPSRTDDLEGAYWVSPPLPETVELDGRGTFRLYSRSWTESAHLVTLCAAVYSVPAGPAAIANPVPPANAPAEIGRFYVNRSWPSGFQPVTVDVQLGLDDGWQVAAGRRIGLRLWVGDDSGDDIVLLYDHHDHESSLTLVADEERQ